jgi:outer membrane protein assembly factor BamB
MMTRLVGFAIGAVIISTSLSADDWPAFRGPTGNGISAEKAAPTTWSADKNIKWKVALPQKCNGSPIVSNGHVFVSCPEDPQGKERSLYCFDRKDGKKLWVRTVSYAFGTDVDQVHPTNFHCSGTPAANGKVVLVWHNSAGLHAYDFEGKELWKRDLGEFRHMWGHATSPVIHGEKVFLNSGPGKRVFFTALSLADGKTLWETGEPSATDDPDYNELKPKQPKGSWSTPVFVKVDGKEQVLCTMPTRVVAYNPDDGKILWWCEGIRPSKGDLSYSSPVVAGDVLVAIGGYGGAAFGVKLGGGSGDVTASRQLWRRPQNPQSIGSGVVVDGHAFIPFENQIECMDPATGKAFWHDRGGKGGYWGSIVFAAGRLYLTDQSGATVVFKPSAEKFELLSRNELHEQSNSTPAISDGEIFIRTHKSLFCIAE